MRAAAVASLIVAVAAVRASVAAQVGSGGSGRWYKGNTHTHTLNSDGDSTPDEVATWYREHGYQFLVLTDHNFLTSVDGLNAVHGASDQFLVIKGEEVTDRFGDKPIHINGLDVSRLVEPQHGSSVVDVVQRNVDAIRKAGGIPHINHPNFGWAITADDLKAVGTTSCSRSTTVITRSTTSAAAACPGMEEVWDRMLSSGKLIYGLADDDAHVFKQPGNPDVPGPGTRLGVRPRRAAGGAADRRGARARRLLRVHRRRAERLPGDGQGASRSRSSRTRTSKYRVQFIGRNGAILSEAIASPADLRVQGRRAVRPRQGARVERPHRLDAAGLEGR